MKTHKQIFDAILAEIARRARDPKDRYKKRGAKWESDARIFPAIKNSDDSVDAEIRILVPRSIHERSIMIWLSQLCANVDKVKLPGRRDKKSHYWMALGCRYKEETISDDKRDQYLKFWGMLEIALYNRRTYYYREHFLSAVESIDRMRASWARKATEVVMRLTWDPTNYRPERKGEFAKVTKKKPKRGKHAKTKKTIRKVSTKQRKKTSKKSQRRSSASRKKITTIRSKSRLSIRKRTKTKR